MNAEDKERSQKKEMVIILPAADSPLSPDSPVSDRVRR